VCRLEYTDMNRVISRLTYHNNITEIDTYVRGIRECLQYCLLTLAFVSVSTSNTKAPFHEGFCDALCHSVRAYPCDVHHPVHPTHIIIDDGM